jgi:hypothetical protein
MLVASPEMLDLGKIKYGKVYDFTYLIVNKGENPVYIKEIVESCKSCTSARISSKVVNPNENVVLHVAYTPGSTGRQLRSINIIHSNDDVLKVDFKGFVDE